MILLELFTPDVLKIVGSIVVSLGTGIGGYLAAKRQQRTAERKDSQSEMEALIKANTDFRNEVRKDLADARERIAVLEKSVSDKDAIIINLQAQVLILESEIRRFAGDDYEFPKFPKKV